jgi:hypothetical protein
MDGNERCQAQTVTTLQAITNDPNATRLGIRMPSGAERGKKLLWAWWMGVQIQACAPSPL